MVAGFGRRDAIALIGVIVLVAVPAWSATRYPAYLGAAGLSVPLLVALVSWWWKGRRATAVPAAPAQMEAAADQLAQRMLDAWRQEARDRRITMPAPVRIRWQWGPTDVTPALADVTAAPVPGSGPRPLPDPHPDPDPPGVLLETGVVTRLHDEVYCRLPHGRLVLLGGPGRARPER